MLIKLSSASRQLVLQKNMMFLICITGQDPDGDYSAATYFFNIISNEWTRGKVAIFKLALLWNTLLLNYKSAFWTKLYSNKKFIFSTTWGAVETRNAKLMYEEQTLGGPFGWNKMAQASLLAHPSSGRDEEQLDGEVGVKCVDQSFAFQGRRRSVEPEVVEARAPKYSTAWNRNGTWMTKSKWKLEQLV